MDDVEKKAFDLASDVTKQLIALSTGIVSLCAAFTDKVFTKSSAQENSCLIGWALTLFVCSILFGLLTQMKMTGIVANRVQREDGKSVIYDAWTRAFSSIQLLTFFAGVFLSLIFVFLSLNSQPPSLDKQCEPQNPVADTLVIQVECNQNIVTDRVKRQKRESNSCVKYIRYNSCNDTVVAKSLVDSLIIECGK